MNTEEQLEQKHIKDTNPHTLRAQHPTVKANANNEINHLGENIPQGKAKALI